MKIKDIREATAAVASTMANASLDFSRMTVSVVAVVSDVVRDRRPLVGYGFCTVGRYAQGGILRERLIPRVLDAEPAALLDDSGENFAPERVWAHAMTNEKPGGHGDRAVALSALDCAVWDLVAKIADRPLWHLIAERHNEGRHDERVMVYPGGGYYAPGKTRTDLQDEMRGYLDLGYRTVKMKIGGAPVDEDLKRIEAVLEVVGDGSRLAVDANGVFDRDTALSYAEAIAPFGLMWFEEPGDPLDYALNAALAERYQGPLATGECLLSCADARNPARHAGLRRDRDWLQFDPALCYGPTEYLRIIRLFDERGWSRRRHLPHGGHQLGLHLAAGLGLGGSESYPGVFQPFGGFADAIPIEDGATRLPDAPGIGIELKSALHAVMRDLLGTD